MEMVMTRSDGMRARVRMEGRYHVQSRSLRLNGIGNPPHEFWVVRMTGDRCLIETTEEESFWVDCSEITRAIELGWVVREPEELW